MTSDQEQLVVDNMKLVYFIIRKYYPTFVNDEDIQQVGMVGLVSAAKTWDSSVSKFNTYAGRCIINEINAELRSRRKHQTNLSLDNEIKVDDGEVTTFMEFLVGDEDVDTHSAHMDSFIDTLDDRDKQIIEYLSMGYNGVEIAEFIGISKQAVNKRKRNMEIRWRKFNGKNSGKISCRY